MSGDFSRQTLEREKQYSTVYMQQGRVLTDYDWNAAQAVEQHRTETEAVDVIGEVGVPKNMPNSFRLTPQGSSLRIGAGRCYVQGLLVENPADCLLTDAGNGLGITLPASNEQGLYLAYLAVQERHITALENPAIREVALGGPDTTTRLQNAWQVRLYRLGGQDVAAACETTNTGAWSASVAAGSGTMKASPVPGTSSSDPCDIPPAAGHRGPENQLYVVEIQRGGILGGVGLPPTCKWSRENASVVSSVEFASGTVVRVSETGKDEVLQFASGQWAELRDDKMELSGQAGLLVQIQSVKPDTREITLTANIPGSVDYTNGHAKLIRWDHPKTAGDNAGIPLQNAPFELENGLQIEFTNGTYRAGDYWLIPARTAINSETGNIEWPRDSAGNYLFRLPHGIRRVYAKLALLNYNGASFSALTNGDCRKFFPSLTTIAASDVSFDDTFCELDGVKTVQQAIDALCKADEGCCAAAIQPGKGWTADFVRAAQGEIVNICFQAGEYRTNEPLLLRDKQSVVISGAGAGTRLIAEQGETVLRFENCANVTVRDLQGEAKQAGRQGITRQLNGVVTFQDCPQVLVEHVTLQCAGGTSRMASCLKVIGTENNQQVVVSPDVRILHSDMMVGNNQIGMLLINVRRATVEDNTVRNPPGAHDLTVLLKDKNFRGALRRQLFANPLPSSATTPTPKLRQRNASLMIGELRVYFETDSSLAKGAWNAAFAAMPMTTPPTTSKEIMVHANAVADRVLDDAAFRASLPAFKTWFDNLAKSLLVMASQGIVIAGRSATDIHIVNNTIEDVVQGIHLGMSHGDPAQTTRDSAESVTIANNRVIVAETTVRATYHGIFVGNVKSLLVENNYVRVKTSRASLGEGVRIMGTLGRMAIVRQNHLIGVSTGITVNPLPGSENPKASLWMVTTNMIPNCGTPVVRPSTVRVSDNLT